jgi:tetratricopeptide (TPR) repeat protein
MTTIIPQFAACRKCGARTPVAFATSTNARKMDSDFCPWSMGYHFLTFALSICPKCNFVGRPDEFELEEGEIKEDHPHQHWEETERLLKEHPISKRFILYAERIGLEGASEKDIGEAYLHASWAERICTSTINRSVESINFERECQQNAVMYLSLALEKGVLSPSVENIYLIGELYRRIGNFPEAAKYFGKATKELEKKKYYMVILENPGPRRDVVEAKIRANSSISKEECLRVFNSAPCKLLGDLTLEESKRWENLLSRFKATVSIKEQTKLPNHRNEVLSLIDKMKTFASEGDSENKTADEKKKIFI